jgi:hypothetical protein
MPAALLVGKMEKFMKHWLNLSLGLVAGLAMVTNANAAEHRHSNMAPSSSMSGQRMAGCGLGSIAIQSNDMISQVLAAFLNGTGVQTFGITSGTSNCTQDGVAHASREKDAYVESNIADLRRDVAAGSGEYMASLAAFYNCRGEATKSFAAGLQRHQDQILGASTEETSRVIDGAVSADHLGCQG